MAAYNNPGTGRNDLHRLMLSIAPITEHGNRSITALGKAIDRSRTTMHTYIANRRLDPATAKLLVDHSLTTDNPLSLKDFEDFVYNV